MDLVVFVLKFYFTFSAFRGKKIGQENGAVSGKRNRKVLRARGQGQEVLRGVVCVCVCENSLLYWWMVALVHQNSSKNRFLKPLINN